MQIKLSKESEAWLQEQLAKGEHASIDDVMESIVASHRLAQIDVTNDDHMWAKPAIDEAIDALARGEGSSLDDVMRRARAAIRHV